MLTNLDVSGNFSRTSRIKIAFRQRAASGADLRNLGRQLPLTSRHFNQIHHMGMATTDSTSATTKSARTAVVRM